MFWSSLKNKCTPHDRIGRYRIVERIACGGTAEVFKALLECEGGFVKPVAVKVLHPSWYQSDEVREMLVDEAKVLVHLSHHGIAQVIELGNENGVPFIAMEFVDGPDCGTVLKRLIADKSAMPVPHILYVMEQLLIALDFAHKLCDENGNSLGLVHRDISPSNILFSWGGEVKLTDFGIAKGTHRSFTTRVGALRGKYSYMSPEQAEGQPVDHRSDLFSCGIVLYEIATAERLFNASSDIELIETVKKPQVPRDRTRKLSPYIQTILIRALTKDPLERYQSASSMLADVKVAARYTDEISTSIEFSSYVRKFKRSSKRYSLDNDQISISYRTEVMSVGLPKQCNIFTTYLKSAILILTLLFSLGIVPTKNESPRIIEAAVVPVKPETQISLAKPDDITGSVAVDSEPSGVSGTLNISENITTFKTPFTVSDIKLESDVNAKLTLSAPGFKSVADNFTLSKSKPAFVKTYRFQKELPARLFVTARPWAKVDIKGILSNRETPIAGLSIPPGEHIMTISHPPSGQKLSKKISSTETKDIRCSAELKEKWKITCR